MKTVRFASVVEQCGQPVHHITWSAPAKDPALKKAAEQGRLLTVHQEVRGSKKDFGVAAFEIARNAQYFLFPQSLKRFAQMRITAIRYDLAGDAVSLVPAGAPHRAVKSATPGPKVTPFSVAPAPAFPKAEPKPKPQTKPASKAKPHAQLVETPREPPKLLTREAIKDEVLSALSDLRRRRVAAASSRLAALSDRL